MGGPTTKPPGPPLARWSHELVRFVDRLLARRPRSGRARPRRTCSVGRLAIALLVPAGLLMASLWPLMATGRTRTTILRITPEQDRPAILRRLEASGVIRSARALDLALSLTGHDGLPDSGTYATTGRLAAIATWERLLRGEDRLVSVTVPEGWSLKRIDAHLATRGLTRPGAFLEESLRVGRHVERHPWLGRPRPPETLEGYCFPDTYFLPEGAIEPGQLIDRMLTRFEKAVLEPFREHASPGLTLHEALTLASLVELEAARPEERAHIAGVFFNRLERHMRLGSDPTVEYALGWHQGARGLRSRDIAIDSPYNTYRVTGLPPGPIGNPGRDSFVAVLKPEKTDDLYFVARGGGRHVFTRTYRDHLAAIRQIRGR